MPLNTSPISFSLIQPPFHPDVCLKEITSDDEVLNSRPNDQRVPNEGNLAIFGYVAFQFPVAVAIRGILFWAVMPCSMRC